MGQQAGRAGPYTEYLAGELRAQQARLQLTLDDIEERSGVPRGTVHTLLKGQRAIPVETFALLCAGLGLDPGELMHQAFMHQLAEAASTDD